MSERSVEEDEGWVIVLLDKRGRQGARRTWCCASLVMALSGSGELDG